jgi:DNA-binding GntR family transcriptional regulator
MRACCPAASPRGAGEHYGIIDAVIEGDATAAEQLTRDHFGSVAAANASLRS